jgi:hypothetical protein
MWQIKNPEIKPATLDFSSSGQGRLQASQLFADGIEIINALELVDWDGEKIQFLICEACGFTRCKSGDWVSLRRSGPLILILPAREAITGESRETEEYRPPYYLRQKGIAYFHTSTYEDLRSQHSAFPAVEKFRQLSVQEATLLYHWGVPAHVLGEPPHINIRRDIVLASSEGDHVEYIKQVEDVMLRQYKDESTTALRDLLDGEKVITLFLDAEEFIEWDALAYDGSAYRLLVDSKYVVDANRAS